MKIIPSTATKQLLKIREEKFILEVKRALDLSSESHKSALELHKAIDFSNHLSNRPLLANYIVQLSGSLYVDSSPVIAKARINHMSLLDVFRRIENDDRVILFDKLQAWNCCYKYMLAKANLLLLNEYYPIKHKRKQTNLLHVNYLKWSGKIQGRLPRNKAKRATAIEQNKQHRIFFFGLKSFAFNLIPEIKQRRKSISQFHEFLQDNLRGLQKQMLPELYETILLLKDNSKGKFGKPAMEKAVLLFDLLKLLLPEKEFLTESKFNERQLTRKKSSSIRTYVRYQYDTVYGIMRRS